MKKVIFLFFLFVGELLHAQFTVNNPAPRTTDDIVKNILVGAGVTPTNIKFNGTVAKALLVNDQAGFWKTNINPTNTGFAPSQQGLLLTTGKVSVALGPNNLPDASSPTSTPYVGDADLKQLSGQTMNNVAILEFDFVATGLELDFDFVFGSEEYPEWVGSQFNDSFGFFLSGPGILGPYSNGAKNIALIPGTNTGVSIGTVNSNANSAYYVDNTGGIDLQYDGFTKVMRAKSDLQCGGTYHIKLAIGNAGTNTWDSGVLIKNFTVPPLELVDNYGLSNNPTVCYGETLTIISGITVPGAVFKWTKDGVALADSGSNLLVTSSGTYGLKVYTAAPGNCLFASDDITIGYLPAMPINDPKNISSCNSLPPPYTFNIDQTAAMLGTQHSSDYYITYYDSSFQDAHDGVPTGVIPNGNLTNYVVNGASKTIWVRFEEVNGNGCVEVKPFDINIYPLPSITGPSSVCLGLEIQLTGSITPALTNPWESSNTAVATVDDTGLVKGISEGNTIITYTNSNGCLITTTIVVPALPTVMISGTTTICEGGQADITFTGTPNTTVTYTVDGGSNQTIALDSSGTKILTTPVLLADSTYSLVSVVMSDNQSCGQLQSGTATITVLGAPTASVSYAGPYCVSFGGQVPVTQTGVTGGVYSASPNGLTINETTGDITPSSSILGNYTVSYTVTATTGCPQLVKTTTVVILDVPHPNIDSGYLCLDPDTNVILPGSTVVLDSGLNSVEYTFEWYDSLGSLVGTQSTLQTDVAGVYTLITKTAGPTACSSTVNMIVGTSYPAKSASAIVSNYFEDGKITVDVIGNGSYLYELDGTGNFQESNVFTNVSPGTHIVTVHDTVGCTNLILTDIRIIDFQHFFTPNGDGYNETWNISSLSGDQPNAEIHIFDRFGKLLTVITPGGAGWDGTYNGSLLPSNDYWFTINYLENGVGKIFKSHFSLKR